MAGLERRALIELLREAFAELPGAPSVRVEAPGEAVDARGWLAAQDAGVRVYWRSRDGLVETAGVGAADTVEAPVSEAGGGLAGLLAEVRSGLSCIHPEMRYFGGWAFDTGLNGSCWRGFGTSRFVLPRFELNVRAGQSVFACNACRADATPSGLEAIGEQFGRLRNVGPVIAAPVIPSVLSREDTPPRAAWECLVERALTAIGAGEFEKVVLARQVKLAFDVAPDPCVLLDQLGRHAENTYLFLVQPSRDAAFLGATPERLCAATGRYVKTEALAGTRPRGNDAAADAGLSDDLMHNGKELREHGIVADRLREVLGRFCGEVRAEREVSLVRLHRCQHLARPFEGIMSNGSSDGDVLAALHPTPAVGGHPDGPALAWLRRNEPFSRGWYAGAVGWAGHDACEFAMGIRSGLVDGNTLTLYAGAGIVAGSVPGAEWEETESKLAAFIDVIDPS